jgi:hypothetical protein
MTHPLERAVQEITIRDSISGRRITITNLFPFDSRGRRVRVGFITTNAIGIYRH